MPSGRNASRTCSASIPVASTSHAPPPSNSRPKFSPLNPRLLTEIINTSREQSPMGFQSLAKGTDVSFLYILPSKLMIPPREKLEGHLAKVDLVLLSAFPLILQLV